MYMYPRRMLEFLNLLLEEKNIDLGTYGNIIVGNSNNKASSFLF